MSGRVHRTARYVDRFCLVGGYFCHCSVLNCSSAADVMSRMLTTGHAVLIVCRNVGFLWSVECLGMWVIDGDEWMGCVGVGCSN